jgi:hypothetical protein
VPLPAPFRGRRPADEDMLLHAALHIGFQHGFRVRLAHYVDVMRLLAAPVDQALLWSRARAWRARGCLASVLAVAARLAGSSAARPPVSGGEVPASVRGWIAGHTAEWDLLDGLPLARARWALAEGAICRARLLAGTLWPGQPDGRREVSPWKALSRGRRLLHHLR